MTDVRSPDDRIVVTADTPLTEPAAASPGIQETLQDILERFQNFVVLFLTISALMVGAGYVVVNSHLWRYTRQHGYTINTNSYLTTGVMLFGFFVALFSVIFALVTLYRRIDRLVDEQRDIVPINPRYLWLVWLLLAVVAGAVTFAITQQAAVVTLVVMTMVIVALRKVVRRAMNDPLSELGGLVFLALIAYVTLGGFLFGRSLYWRIPRSVGGGHPPVVQLVFQDADVLRALHLPAASDNPRRDDLLQLGADADNISDNLCLLAEVDGGLLIYNPLNRTSMSVRSEDLLGVRDVYRTNEQLAEDQLTFNCAPPLVSDDLLGGLGELLGSQDVQAPSTPTPTDSP